MARNEDGNTPLHTAAGWSSLIEELERHQRHAGAAVVALLEAGADPLARNEAGETPWDLAQANELLRGSDAYWRLTTRGSTHRHVTSGAKAQLHLPRHKRLHHHFPSHGDRAARFPATRRQRTCRAWG